jgi:o-succinylbenzoate synthase
MAESDIAGFGEAGDLLPGQRPDDGNNTDSDQTVLSLFDEYINGAEIPLTLDDVNNILDAYPGYISPALRFGLESALCDLAARISEKSLSKWLAPDAKTKIPVNYLISRPIEDWDELRKTIDDGGYRAVKIKVGTDDIERDIQLIRLVRETLGQSLSIRLDANRGWVYATARDALLKMKQFNIEYVEEPLKPTEFDRLPALEKETGIRVALDESLGEINNIEEILTTGVCGVLIVKSAVIGGLIKTIRLSKLAAHHGCRVVLTSNLETEIGLAAQLHLAAALPRKTSPCGLDTLRFFNVSETRLTHVVGGSIEVPPGDGLGHGAEVWGRL